MARKYQDWMDFCTKMQIDHTLEDPEVPIMESFKCLESWFVTDLSPTGCQGSG